MVKAETDQDFRFGCMGTYGRRQCAIPTFAHDLCDAIAMVKKTIDFCVGWGSWPDEPFAGMILKYCQQRRLSCVICKDDGVRQLIQRTEAGTARIGFHLDVAAEYEEAGDRYARLAYAAKDGGAFVVNEPDHARAAVNKAVLTASSGTK